MTVQGILKLVKEVTYKPGWEITARPERSPGVGFGELVIVKVQAKVIDVDDPERKRELILSITFAVQPGTAEDQVLFMIHRTIWELEIHEIDEWLKHKGKYLNQPHPLPKD